MLKSQKVFIALLFAFSFCTVFGQGKADVFRSRFNKYLNFHGSLSPYVAINDRDVRIYKSPSDKFADKPELLIEYSEIKTFEYLLKNAPQDSIEAILQRKGAKKWSKKTVGELLIQYEEEPLNIKKVKPLDGKKIVIDPGHIAGNHEMAFIEQKYIRFVKDSFPALPHDSIKLQEGVLAYATSFILKKMLEEQGAVVVLTRGENKSVFGMSYEEWLIRKKKKTLDSLKNSGQMNHSKYTHLQHLDDRNFFWEFFRDYELAARARFINDQNPDITIIIHYNVDEKNDNWVRPGEKNYTMVFMPGAMGSDVFNSYNGKLNFLRLLLTEDLPQSEKLSSLTVAEFSKQLNIQTADISDASYLLQNCMTTGKEGVFCRNLALCKSVKSPLVYGECLYQDNLNECAELCRNDKVYYGIKTNSRVKSVSDAYFNAVMQFYKK